MNARLDGTTCSRAHRDSRPALVGCTMHTLVSLGCACVLLMFGNHSLVKDPAVALSTNWILGSPARPRSKSASAGKGATRACDDRETDAETVEVAR